MDRKFKVPEKFAAVNRMLPARCLADVQQYRFVCCPTGFEISGVVLMRTKKKR